MTTSSEPGSLLEPPLPVLRPTAEEWQDFPAYVRKVVPEIEDAGGATIVPPREWPWSPPDLDPSQRIKPIRQHFFRAGSGSGSYTGIFEEAAPQSLGEFMAQAQSPPAVADLTELRSLFWRRIVTREQGVLYGADTDVASLFEPGLGFASLLPSGTEGDLLRYWHEEIPGLNKPMLYFGGWRSTFCLHTEDSELSGISFLHRGAPKLWYVVPPEFAERVRALASTLYPSEARACAQFLRHKGSLIAPATLRAHGIPVSTAVQTEGTFVLVLSSAFHFGFNAGFNCAEAVNFALKEWVPHGRLAQTCTCGDGQTPFVGVPALMRAVRAAEPTRAADWWCFECACGRFTGASNFDDEEEQPEGALFECSLCGNWGHLACYAEQHAATAAATATAAAAAAAAAAAPPECAVAGAVREVGGELLCVRCVDAWRGGGEAWRFSCVCGRNEGATPASFEAPSGRQFECDGCGLWAHTECFDDYRGALHPPPRPPLALPPPESEPPPPKRRAQCHLASHPLAHRAARRRSQGSTTTPCRRRCAATAAGHRPAAPGGPAPRAGPRPRAARHARRRRRRWSGSAARPRRRRAVAPPSLRRSRPSGGAHRAARRMISDRPAICMQRVSDRSLTALLYDAEA